jgi:putative ABC transport system substrate-binding protein
VKRREFITLLSGAAAAWPLAVRAQQALPAIGFLHEGLPAPLSLTTAFQQGLIEAGISAGSSLRIENRWAEGLRWPGPPRVPAGVFVGRKRACAWPADRLEADGAADLADT